MSLYRYEAVDRAGNIVRGVMDAASEQAVAQKLSAMGYDARTVFSASQQAPSRQTQTSTAPPPQASQRNKNPMSAVSLANGLPISIKSSVPAHTLGMFFRQLSTLVKAGHPLYQASTYIRVSHPKIKAFLPVMQDRIQSGQKLSGAMAEFPKVFPVHAIASVWCGELAGKLDVVLDELAADFESEARETRIGRFGWFIAKATIFVFILMIPLLDFESLLNKVMGKGLGAAITTFTSGIKSALPYAIAFLVLLEVWGFIKRIPAVRHALDVMLLKTPIWGKLHRYRATAKFFHVLDMMLNAGISLGTAWDAASMTPRNSQIAKGMKFARTETAQDSSVVSLLERSKVFEMDDIGFAAAAEKSGSLPEAAANIAVMHESRVHTQKTIGRFWAIASILALNGVLTLIAVYMMAKGEASILKTTLESIGK